MSEFPQKMYDDLRTLHIDVMALISVIACEGEDNRGCTDAEVVAIAATNADMVRQRLQKWQEEGAK